MSVQGINLNDKVASKNLGVMLDGGKIKMCFFEKVGDSIVAVSLSDLHNVDFSKVWSYYKQ